MLLSVQQQASLASLSLLDLAVYICACFCYTTMTNRAATEQDQIHRIIPRNDGVNVAISCGPIICVPEAVIFCPLGDWITKRHFPPGACKTESRARADADDIVRVLCLNTSGRH